jgi:ADP-heptose:LPS heptosyltransferase
VESAALAALRAGGVGDWFALLNGGAAWPNKRWPAERFGRLAAWLRDEHGLSSVVLWGPGESALAAEVVAHAAGAAVAAPETDLRDLVAIARAASIVISGDTGPTHIAGAVGTPIVSIFGPTDPGRNGPWDPEDEILSRYAACACHYQRACRRGPDDWCLRGLTESDVREAVTRRLSRRPAC